MLVYLYNTHLLYTTWYKLAATQGSFMYTNTARGEGEGGSSKGERESSRRQGD